MSTRLERLVGLLDSGSNDSVRATAAEQLGEIAATRPEDLPALLERILPSLRSKNWKTRLATGLALEHISKAVPPWNPTLQLARIPAGAAEPNANQDPNLPGGQLALDGFSLEQILERGQPLLASPGKEFDEDTADYSQICDAKDRLQKQKMDLRKRLGFGSDFVDDLDLLTERDVQRSSASSSHARSKAAAANVAQQIGISSTHSAGMSARERARLKRKQKLESKIGAPAKGNATAEEHGKTAISAYRGLRSLETREERLQGLSNVENVQTVSGNAATVASIEETGRSLVLEAAKEQQLWQDLDEWPFEAFCEELSLDLFDPHWEIRHGAAIGLREIIKAHGRHAGKTATLVYKDDADLPTLHLEIHQKQNQAWLQDICVRLLCVFALDRFSDFEGNTVVVPVRETCAQTLGAATHCLQDTSLILELMQQGLLSLCKNRLLEQIAQWGLRLGGLLGCKYIFAVRKDMVAAFLKADQVFSTIVEGIQDSNDDIRTVSASTLVPIATAITQHLPIDKVAYIVKLLWGALEDPDDLSASTVPVMELLARFYSIPTVLLQLSTLPSLSPSTLRQSLFPRLYPLFRHSVSNVRVAVLQTVDILGPVLVEQEPKSTDWLLLLMEQLFQNLMLEDRRDIQEQTIQTWQRLLQVTTRQHISLAKLARPSFSRWLSLVMHPIGSHMPVQRLPIAGSRWQRNLNAAVEKVNVHELNVSAQDAAMLQQDMEVVEPSGILFGRVSAVTLLAQMLATMEETLFFALLEPYNPLKEGINGRQVLHGQLFAVAVEEWCKASLEMQMGASAHVLSGLSESSVLRAPCVSLHATLLSILDTLDSSDVPILDLQRHYLQLRVDCLSLLQYVIRQGNLSMQSLPAIREVGFSGLDAQLILSDWIPTLVQSISLPADKVVGFQTEVQGRMQRIANSLASVKEAAALQNRPIHTATASALLPLAPIFQAGEKPKLNPIVRSLMNGVKFETMPWLQKRNAGAVAAFIDMATSVPLEEFRELSVKVASKMVQNLVTFLCSDPKRAKLLEDPTWREPRNAIVAFDWKSEDVESDAVLDTVVRGATFAFEAISHRFGNTLVSRLSTLQELLQPLLRLSSTIDFAARSQEMLNALQVVKTIAPFVHREVLLTSLLPLISHLLGCMRTGWPILRHFSAESLAVLCRIYDERKDLTGKSKLTKSPMHLLLEQLPSLLGDTTNVTHRLGAAETMWHVLREMDVRILPYLAFLLVPALGRMSDQDDAVRFAITRCFSIMVRLMPLEAAAPDPTDLPPEMMQRKAQERSFITQLLDPSRLEPFTIPIPIRAELRSYQKDGVNWLWFLNKYQLHGILCDDMGLGKTLQTICIMASDHHLRAERFAKEQAADAKRLPNLVVCPTSVTGHWYHEILQYTENLKPLEYTGNPTDRRRLLPQFPAHDVVITSYDILRNDIEYFSQHHYNYCVLDEGHIIKNPKTKTTLAVKTIRANHRLLLSGTPIQNNVLELWSLFDFLMPGFLGTEKQFQERFVKPIVAMKALGGKLFSASNSSSSGGKHAQNAARVQEAGTLALESLHRQVLPFLLRRMKENVLHDLPPKIIQDVYCEMSAVQQYLYTDFTTQQAAQMELAVHERSKGGSSSGGHVFQALQYLRKLCNHPALVLNEQHPQMPRVTSIMERGGVGVGVGVGVGGNIRDLQHSPKLLALRDVLQQCGIGIEPEATAESQLVAPHRALVFCQLKSMVDFIEMDLLKTHMPNVSYLRMDGSTDALKRHEMVMQFNRDPSIDLLLLTTSVGGLGLNLTGADTVIFVEHDWNPMKDLQAMDRAHRIGQKRVVNVYRLITKNTLEEKIMGLQRFKLNIANTIINEENSGSGLRSMGNEEILDLFRGGTDQQQERQPSKKKQKVGANVAVPGQDASSSVWEELEQKGASEEYDQAFDFGQFVSSFGGNRDSH